MKYAVIMSGLPGTGKSTFINKMLAADKQAFLYSSDNFIEEFANREGLTYNESFAKYKNEAFQMAEDHLKIAISNGQNIVWDQTNLTSKKRKSIVSKLRAARYERITCIYFELSEDDVVEWEARLASRPGKTIPHNVIESMSSIASAPDVSEGFDEVHVYSIDGSLKRLQTKNGDEK